MKLLLTNPAGLWALLAIPLILLIHFLQEKSRKVRISTLFLLERLRPESVSGARFEKLRQSVPLWMQLLAALLITWILAEPRWIREDSRQIIAVVLDSSVSMSAFKDKTRIALAEKLRSWSHGAAQTDWHLLESNPRKPTLYTGADLAGLLDAYDRWEPTLGTHRPDDTLLTARGLVKSNGLIIFVTDRKADVTSDVAVLSVGEATENVGFAGVEVKLINESNHETSGTKWRALVKNYGRERQTREWWVEEIQGSSTKVQGQKQRLDIEAGKTMALTGELPPDIERTTLVLEGDRFTWDDRLPIQKPKTRLVNIDQRLSGRSGETLHKMLSAMDHITFNNASSNPKPETQNPKSIDLVVAELGTTADTNAIQLATSSSDEPKLEASLTVAEDHLLTRDLNWMGLLTGKPMELTVTENDEPLLWKGDRVLALLRNNFAGDGRKIKRLILGWDIAVSNAARDPAMLVLLQRFVEMVRESKQEPWAGNFEVGQRMEVQGQNGDDRAPEHPGFFEVIADGKPFISGAATFADAREADFKDAAPIDTVEARRWEAALKQTEADPWMALWVLLVLGCLVISWARKAQASRVQVQGLTSA